MNLTTKLLSAAAATTLTAAALTFTTTTPAEAQPAGLAEYCHSVGGSWAEGFYSWECAYPYALVGDVEPVLEAACLDPHDPWFDEEETYFRSVLVSDDVLVGSCLY